ncbi:MAG: acyltransferase [Nitrososphaerota archaeon]|jgi:carbonic anhydrase/acetyltransferase-like protein (isoleucine patch superfamily)|nr:acyltransferase [Nitrososphaerota archaeon]
MKPFEILNRITALSSELYIRTLRKKGVSIGDGTVFFPGGRNVDLTRPCLIEIGRNCVFTQGVQICTHGYDWAVLREKYGEMFCSSGKVVIGDNVFVGVNTVILKGVKIGKNVIIGAGSIVTTDIPDNCVAAGNPCRVIMSIEQYFEKRKKAYVEEAKTYAFELYRKTGRVPGVESFWEEFPIFLQRDSDWGPLPVKKQLGSAFNNFMNSKPLYPSFDDFLIAAGIPEAKVKSAYPKARTEP